MRNGFEIKTDGSINPKMHLLKLKVLIHHLCCFLTKELHSRLMRSHKQNLDEESLHETIA
jgi:hypothetical protein